MQTKSPSAAERWLEFVDPKHRQSHIYEGCRWEWEDTRWVNMTARREAEALLTADARLDSDTLQRYGQREERIYDASPGWSDLKREFGEKVVQNPDGSGELRHFTPEEKKRLGEMYGDARALEIEKSEDLSAGMDWVTVGKGKKQRTVIASQAEKVDRAMGSD